jgi:hypothetical protein
MTVLSAQQTVAIALSDAFAGLDACCLLDRTLLATRPPYPDAWTIAEQLEHVCLANHYLLLTIGKGCRIACRRAAAGKVAEGETDLAPLAALAEPGRFDWQPPPHMVPEGGREAVWLRQELRRQGDEARRLLAALGNETGRLYRIRMSVNALGKLDMYQWLYFLAQHVRYHLRLIAGQRTGRG